MDNKPRKRFFANHAKSSAAVVSVAIHALLIVVALSFVAVTVITKDDQSFESKQANRPKMALKKLKVPVTIKKKVQKPRLRKRIVVNPRVSQNMPDIKMPEITGVKGGMGNATGGLGDSSGIGFTMPEIDIFGLKSRGEKVFIILDSSTEMMKDERGGIPAYTIIKEELVRIMGGLPSTALFNVVVYDGWNTVMLFPKMVSANSANVSRLEQWLKPLNAVQPEAGSTQWGTGTLGPGGTRNSDNFLTGKFEKQELWYRPAMLAMKQQADTVFLLTSWWGHQRIQIGESDDDWYNSSAGRRWKEAHEKAKLLLDEDNKKRAAAGQPPRAIDRNHAWRMNDAYFPDIERPPQPEFYYHTPREYAEGFLEIRQKFKAKDISRDSRLSKRSSRQKVDFSFNVIHFTTQEPEPDEWRQQWYFGRTLEGFKKLTSLCKGNYRAIGGLAAIQSYVQ